VAHGGQANGKDNDVRILLFCALAASLCSQVIENSVTIIPKADDSATGQLLFREKKANGTNVLKFQAPASLSGDVTWTLPTADGTASQCLVTNGSGVLSFAACTNYWFRSGTTLSPATAGDDLNLSGNITSSSTSGTKDIGSSANKWRDIYIGGTTYTTTLDDNGDANNQIVLAAGLRPSADNTWNVGSSSYRVAGLWVNSIVANTITYASGTGSTVTLYANMAPLSNNNFALGTTSLRWSKVWTTDLDASGGLTLGGDLTLAGHILSSATSGTKDVGSSTNRFATLYATNIDAAPTSGTTNYIKTRKFEVVDNAGGSTQWDIQVTSGVTTNNFKIRDNAGTYRLELVNKEESTGTTVNEARLNYHTVPLVHNTWDLGTSSKRWKDLYLQGSATIAGNATVSGTTATVTLDDISDANNQIILGAGFRPSSDNSVNFGSSSYRIAGLWSNSITVNTLTYASGTGSTITLYANMAPYTNNNFALGTTSLRFSKLWVTDIDMSGTCTGCPGTMWTRSGTTVSLATSGDTVSLSGDLVTTGASAYTIGSSGNRWNNIYTLNANHSGTVQAGSLNVTGAGSFTGNVSPNTNETYTLGTSSNRWDIVYSRRFEANDGTYGRIVLNNPGAGSNSGNAIAVNNASGTSKFYVSYGGTVSTGPISFNGNLYTSADNTYSLGDSTNRLSYLYAYNLALAQDADARYYFASGGFYVRPGGSTVDQAMFADTGSGYFGTQSNHPLAIRTNNTTRVTIAAGGDVTFAGNVIISGTCTGCGAASYWSRNGAGYVYPTTTGDSVMIGSTGTPGAKLEVSGGGIKLGGSITFAIGSAYDLGTSSARAATVYGYYGNFTSTVTAGGLSLAGSVTPTTSSAYDIGSTTYPFQNIYATQIIARNTTNSVNQVVIGGLTSTAIGFYNTSGSLTGYITRNGSFHGDYASMTGGYNAWTRVSLQRLPSARATIPAHARSR